MEGLIRLIQKPPPSLAGKRFFQILVVIKDWSYFAFLRAGLRLALTRFGLAIVLRQEVQTFILQPSMVLHCRLMFCRFRVLILEWEREAPLVAPRPHKSHFFAILLVQITPGFRKDNPGAFALMILKTKLS